MQHLQPGELVSLKNNKQHYLFLVLTKSAFFGCQWTYALYKTHPQLPETEDVILKPRKGFVALIDFIEPRRNNSVIRIAKGFGVEEFMSFTRMKAFIRNSDTHQWYIYDRQFSILEKKPLLTEKELDYPIASGMKVAKAFELIDARWHPRKLVSLSQEGQFPTDK